MTCWSVFVSNTSIVYCCSFAAVVIEPVGVDGQVVRVRTAPDEPGHPVDGRIDDVVDVAGVVALEDPHRHPVVGVEPGNPLRCRWRHQDHDAEEGKRRPDQR